MYSHVDACLWVSGLFTFIALYVICSVIYDIIDSWASDYENDNIDEILVFDEDYTQVFIVYCDHTHA